MLALLGDDRIDAERVGRLRATPAPATFPEVWMLGSSTYGAQVAAALGLPFCYAYHFAMSSDVDTALRLYRSGFQPSPRCPEPHVMVSASVIAAETTEEAQYLAGPSRIMALSLRTGRLGPIVSPESAAAAVSCPTSTAASSTSCPAPSSRAPPTRWSPTWTRWSSAPARTS